MSLPTLGAVPQQGLNNSAPPIGFPTLVFTSASAATAGAVSFGPPTDTAEGDLLIAAIETDASQTITWPVDWNVLPKMNGSTTDLNVAWKLAGPSETSLDIPDSGNHHVCVLMRASGFSNTPTLRGSGTSSQGTGYPRPFAVLPPAEASQGDLVFLVIAWTSWTTNSNGITTSEDITTTQLSYLSRVGRSSDIGTDGTAEILAFEKTGTGSTDAILNTGFSDGCLQYILSFNVTT